MRKLFIGLTYDLRSEYLKAGYTEEETAELDSEITVAAIESVLKTLGHSVERIGGIKSLTAFLADGKRWDLVFNIAEGLHGVSREAQVPALLDAYEIPYTFSSTLTLCAALDKPTAKRLARDHGIRTADFCVIEKPEEISGVKLPYPLFCKPANEGSSKGVGAYSFVQNKGQLNETVSALLEKFRQPVLIEEYLPGKETTVGILGTGLNARVLGVMEICLNAPAGEGYSYENKINYLEKIKYRRADEKTADECSALALRVWRALDCRDAGRVDVKYDKEGEPAFIEINPLAGLNPEYSDLPILCGLLNMPYAALIEEILNSAVKRIKENLK